MFIPFPLFFIIHFVYSIKNGCSGTENNVPYYTEAPMLTKSVKNGKLYEVGDDKWNSTVKMIHVYGSDYEMGYAYGELLKDEIKAVIEEAFPKYIIEELEHLFPNLPDWLIELVEKYGELTALEIVWDLQGPYVDQFIWDIMKGMSDGSGIDLKQIHVYNIMASLIHAGCSIVGAWGKSTEANDLLQIRALDLDLPPLVDYPLILTYHFEDQDDHSNTVVLSSFVGFVGFLSGFISNEQYGKIGWSEKVWLPRLSLLDQKMGKPWNLHFLEVMRYGQTIDQSIDLLRNARRTSSVHIGLGSEFNRTCLFIDYGVTNFEKEGKFIVTTWDNQTTYEEHPRLEDVIYYDKCQQPSQDICMAQVLQTYYGNFTSDIMARKLMPIEQTGNLQAIVYDFHDDLMYYSRRGSDRLPAYQNQYILIDMNFLIDSN